MNNAKVMELLKARDYVVPSFFVRNYKLFGIDAERAFMLVYLINLKEPIVCDYQRFASDLNKSVNEIMNDINELSLNKLIQIDIKKNSSMKLEEYISLDLFYNKIFMQLIDVVPEEESSENIYSVFEKEFGRTLSPIEFELINGWIECNYKEEIILAALKEAIFSGACNFRYIDRILFEWNKKGIDSLDKIEKNKVAYSKSKKSEDVIVPDYDWLNQDE